MSTDALKVRAKNLQRAAQAMFKTPVKLSQAYELIAQEEGYANWDTACAELAKKFVSVQSVSSSLRKPFYSQFSIQLNSDQNGISFDQIDNSDLQPILNYLESSNSSLVVVTGKDKAMTRRLVSYLLSVRQSKAATIMTPIKCQEPPGEKFLDSKRHSYFDEVVKSVMRSVPDIVYMGNLKTVEAFLVAVNTVRNGVTVIIEADANNEQGLSLDSILIEKIKNYDGKIELMKELGLINTMQIILDAGMV